MRALTALTLAGCTWLIMGATASAEVQISIHDGRVTIAAKDATVRQILTEWARVGRTRIVNVERIAGGPITIELNNVPEQDALELLLRSVSGYIAASRTLLVSDASQFDRIIVMPTSAAPRPPVSSASAPPPPPMFGQLSGIMQPPPDDDEARLPGGQQPAITPVFNNFAQPQVANPRRPVMSTTAPGVFQSPLLTDPQAGLPQGVPLSSAPGIPTAQPGPAGAVSAPGMIAPAAAQPGQVVVPQPRRSPNDN